MKYLNTLLSLVLVLAVVLSVKMLACATAVEPDKVSQEIFRADSQKSFVGPEKYFTGKVKVNMLFPSNDTAHFSGAYVTFVPGARTAWHFHPAGQHMIVTSGVALTGTRDGKIIRFKKGETVWCPPGIDHWHGATPEAPMTHLVITGSKNGKNVIWKEKVTDEQYYGKNNKTLKINKKQVLTMKQESIVTIAAFTANGDLNKLKTAMAAGLDAGLTVNEVKEIPIHLYAYCGFPRSLNGIATLMAVVNQRKAKGINDQIGKDATPLPKDFDSLKIGAEVQTELAGQPVKGPLFDFAPVINEYLQAHLFGDIFARDVLDRKTRELVTVSALSNMNGVEPQLKAHIGIAQNVGLTKEQIKGIIEVIRGKVGESEAENAQKLLDEVLNAGTK